jgi:D-alanyl-D-alanine carboxypeptidase
MILKKALCVSPLLLFALFSVAQGRPVIYDTAYYDNTNSYADNSDCHPAAVLLEPLIDRAVSNGLPGAVVLVDTPGAGTWVCARGKIDLDYGIPMKKNSLSRVGSITKIFVSVVILKLSEEGKLSLDDPVSNYLPDSIVRQVENAGCVTIRELLNHTSGIPNYLDYIPLRSNGLTPEKCLGFIYGRHAYFKPGKGAYYSNTGYVLLGMIIEALENKPVGEVFNERIFLPLGLKSTYFDPENPVHRETARGYADLDNSGKYTDTTDFDDVTRTPDGGIVSTVYDLAAFIKAVFNDRSFLSESSLAEMTNNFRVETRFNQDYGLGIIRCRLKSGVFMYGHTGGNIGYSAELYYLPSGGTTVACLFNSSMYSGKSAILIQGLWTEILKIINKGDL